VLDAIGLTVSDAFRQIMVRIAAEKRLPFEPLTPNEETIEAMRAARGGEVLRRRKRALGEKRSYLVETTLGGCAQRRLQDLSCIMFPSLQRIRRLTTSETGLRWEDTMCRKPTCAARNAQSCRGSLKTVNEGTANCFI